MLLPDFKPRQSATLYSLRSDQCAFLALRTRGDWKFNPRSDFLLQSGFTLIAMASP